MAKGHIGLRIAVLSMLEPLAVDGLLTRAGLRVNGDTVVEQQLELALAAGAKRLLILADRRTIGLDDLVAEASEGGLDVRVVADAPGLCSEVTAADDLLVIGDALVADPVLALPMLASSGVVTVPIEQGLAAGFERIDAENAWGGILVIPGALAERLRQLPRDCDVASSLLRIALMAGVSVRPVDAGAIEQMRWAIVRNEADVQAIEAHRLRLSLAEARGRTPGRALAGFLVARFGNRLFEADRSPALVWWAALVPVAAAMGLAAFAIFGAAFFCLALSWLMVRSAMILDAAERQGKISSALPDRRPMLALLGIDILLFVVLGLALTGWTEEGTTAWLTPWCVALVFVCLARLGAVSYPILRARPYFEDRFSQAIVLQFALLGDGLAAIAMLAVMIVMLIWTGKLTLGTLAGGN
ncbi:hypothetical protein [Croceicoccus bisphenolivorans]|uniref:hypothetical protein n=1 Tax=Croceicoccus bisphenolivorans TaxID=1783232 RepID=UPI0008357BF4|nr:hypothetical protein [Croceicoccus bisphenolivorans]